MKKKVGIIKRVLCISLVFLLNINALAAVVSDNDGSAFITKAEFDSLKNNFQSQIDSYNSSIDAKIDGAIASYLAGISLSRHEDCELVTDSIKDLQWVDDIGISYKCYPNTTSAGLYIAKTGAISYGFGSGDPVAPLAVYSSSYNRNLAGFEDKEAPVRPKMMFQDDGDEVTYIIGEYKYFPSSIYSGSSVAQAMPIWALEYEIGTRTKVISGFGVACTLSCGINLAFQDNNVPGAQSAYIPGDNKYGGSYQFWFGPGDENYLIKPTAYNVDSGSTNYHNEYYNYLGLHDYWGIGGTVTAGKIFNGTTYNYPYDEQFDVLGDAKKMMFGKTVNAWIGTVKNSRNTFSSAYATNTWGTGYSQLIDLTYVKIHTKVQGANCAPSYSNKCSAKTAKLAVPNFYSKGKIEEYKNATLVEHGLDVGFCDGAPLFKPTVSGIAHCSLTVTTSDLSAAPIGSVQINIKEDKFSNSMTGNGNTLKYTDAHGVEIDYLQNLTSATGVFDLYFKVTRGKTYYIKITPQEPTGQYYAQITDATITVDGE